MTDRMEKQILHTGSYLRLCKLGRWEFAERTNASGVVVIVGVTDQGRLVLTEQLRVPLATQVIELPAGLAGDVRGDEEESLERAAERELLEETGFQAKSMARLTSGPPSAGLSPEVVTFFWAEGLSRVAAGGGDESEQIRVHEISLSDLPSWLEAQESRGASVDPKVYVGLYFATQRSGTRVRTHNEGATS